MTLPLPFPADRKPLIGVIHLPALPGSPGWTAAGPPRYRPQTSNTGATRTGGGAG